MLSFCPSVNTRVVVVCYIFPFMIFLLVTLQYIPNSKVNYPLSRNIIPSLQIFFAFDTLVSEMIINVFFIIIPSSFRFLIVSHNHIFSFILLKSFRIDFIFHFILEIISYRNSGLPVLLLKEWAEECLCMDVSHSSLEWYVSHVIVRSTWIDTAADMACHMPV